MTAEELFGFAGRMPDERIYEEIKTRWDTIAKPLDGLGVFEKMHARIGGIQRSVHPDIGHKTLLILCADHGVTAEGVTQTGKEVTASVAALMGRHASSVGMMTDGYPLEIRTVDIGIDKEGPVPGVEDRKIARGTADLMKEPAMTMEECLAAIRTGVDLAQECREHGTKILATGEMGIGNTTSSTALLCALTGSAPEAVTGRGAGLSDEGLARKKRVIEEALALHGFDRSSCPAGVVTKEETLRALACVGGLEIAGLCGVYIGSMLCGMPVVVDGLISAVAALTAERLLPGCRHFMFASHCGREQGMKPALRALDLHPVLDAELALGEGSGAVMLFPLLDMTFSLYARGTAFTATDITPYERFVR